MKGRESGMPEEALWSSFYDAEDAVKRLGCVAKGHENIVEFGSGYGTFTLEVARHTSGKVFAFDIEPELVDYVRDKSREAGLTNVEVIQRDFVATGTGLPTACADHAMLYNILHIERPVSLLSEALRILMPGGTASIIHWRSDIETPRGPSLAIRPSPEQCRAWAEQAGFHFVRNVDLSTCCPYHFGLLVMHSG